MRKRLALLLLLVPPLHGCSYSYPIWATVIDGRLAFESGDPGYDCFTNIRVTPVDAPEPDPALLAIEEPMQRHFALARVRDAWMTDAIATYECKGHFPVVYGAPMPEITIVPARPLRIGVAYEVSTYGPKGTGGSGCFRINPDRRPENLPDSECFYRSPATPAAAPAEPPAPAAVPEPVQETVVVQAPEAGKPGIAVSHSAPPAVTVPVPGPAPLGQPINAMPPPDRTGPAQMYALTPYRGIERYLRDYPSLAACEDARAKMPKAEADRRLCGLGPRQPRR